MSLIETQREGHVARLWLNRPEVRNAFNAAAIAELRHAFTQISTDIEAGGGGAWAGVRAVVLGGRGPAFCAGGDLHWMREAAGQAWGENHADALRLAEMLWAVAHCPVPVIARVQGEAFGGGLGLVAAADIAVAAEGAMFCLPEVRLGLLPATIAPYVLRAIGERATRRWALTAERFDAHRALAAGLVHEVCATADLDAAVDRLAHTVGANGPHAVRATKRLCADLAGAPLSAALREDTARRIADARASLEGQAGVRSFLDKTAPPWQTEG